MRDMAINKHFHQFIIKEVDFNYNFKVIIIIMAFIAVIIILLKFH